MGEESFYEWSRRNERIDHTAKVVGGFVGLVVKFVVFSVVFCSVWRWMCL